MRGKDLPVMAACIKNQNPIPWVSALRSSSHVTSFQARGACHMKNRAFADIPHDCPTSCSCNVQDPGLHSEDDGAKIFLLAFFRYAHVSYAHISISCFARSPAHNVGHRVSTATQHFREKETENDDILKMLMQFIPDCSSRSKYPQ